MVALVLAGTMALPGTASAQVALGISVGFAPPEIPVYEQPVCPGEGYIWTPGYWAWGDDGYYWVPGTWVLAPEPGFLWTPGYWGWADGVYIFHRGYWGPHIGYYGGINYGFGYFGHGYEGGRWEHDHFYYNRTVNNINIVNIHNTYNKTVINENRDTRISYNGGQGGINDRPRRDEMAAERDRHIDPVPAQEQHMQMARNNPELRASRNHGAPPIAATARPEDFNNHVSSRAAGGTFTPPENRGNAIHPKELPPFSRPASPNTGNPKFDQKYQQQQEKLAAKQEQDRQRLQAKQDQEHQRMARQQATSQKQQQLEQRHQQQTQQMVQKHQQQDQKLQKQEQHANQSKNRHP